MVLSLRRSGRVQVFARTANAPEPSSTNRHGQASGGGRDQSIWYDDEDDNGFQLLNEVESGGTLSSLFTILSLFTEGINLRYEDVGSEHVSPPAPRMHRAASLDASSALSRADLTSGRAETVPHFPSPLSHEASIGATEEPRYSPATTHTDSGTVPSLEAGGSSIDPDSPQTTRTAVPGSHGPDTAAECKTPPRSRAAASPSRDTFVDNGQEAEEATIARAAVDATLAVIPAEAFRRLTRRYPNASAHIVQVILTRLQRVTFQTSHKYLGLTKELVRTEKALNDLACHPLPAAFYETGGMSRLRSRFAPQTTMTDEPEPLDLDYFALDPSSSDAGPDRGLVNLPTPGPAQPAHAALRMTSRTSQPAHSAAATLTLSPMKTGSATFSSDRSEHRLGRPFGVDRRTSLREVFPRSPGLQMARQAPSLASIGATSLHDFDLRESVMECIAKSIGLLQSPLSGINSVEASPFIAPADRNTSSRPLPFRSGLGSLSFLGLNGVDDESSVTMSSVVSQALAQEELENQVEILFFPRGSTLVDAGERNSGLYYVIDGFVDVYMSTDSSGVDIRSTDDARLGRSANELGGAVAGTRRSSSHGKDATAVPASTKPPTRPRPQKALFSIKPGGIAGYLSAISGFPSYVDLEAKTDVYVGFLPARALEGIMDRKPIVLLTLAKRLLSLLPPLSKPNHRFIGPRALTELAVRHIDTSLDWMATEAGQASAVACTPRISRSNPRNAEQVIYREGERSDSFYMVISGRLRSIIEPKEGVVEVVAEHGQGDSIGELDCITASPRPSTLHAIRDSELVRMPMTLFNAISVRHPPITIQVSRIIASRVRAQVDSVRKTKFSGRGGATELGKNNFNLKTVAVVPNTRHVPIVDFASRLKSSLEDIGAPTLYLNQATVLSVLGRHAFSRIGKLKLAGWLAETEQKYRIVLYVADTPVSSPWTQTCIRQVGVHQIAQWTRSPTDVFFCQADFVMLVSDGGADPAIGEYERLLSSMKTTARKELVLLHPDRNVPAGSTRPWLKVRCLERCVDILDLTVSQTQPRPWIHAHHHVQLAGSTPLVVPHGEGPPPVVALRHLKERVQGQISKYRRSGPAVYNPTVFTDDFARLARRLCGKSIGLVLGGGGARGISHIGVLRVLQERNIPVDMIGGTSIGSFIGGLYARNADLISTLGRAKTFAARMSSMWRIATDVTYPIVAYTSGHLMNRGERATAARDESKADDRPAESGIYKSFYDYHIEVSLWARLRCSTTDAYESFESSRISG